MHRYLNLALYDSHGCISEPCISCEKMYLEDIWFDAMCDEKECIHACEYDVMKRTIKIEEAIENKQLELYRKIKETGGN